MASFSDGPERVPQVAMPRMTPVVKALLVTNAALALPFLFLVGALPFLRTIHEALALDVPAWRDNAPLVPLWQVLTYGFLHDTDSPMHLIGNLIGLYFFGTWLEGLIGSRRFLLVYLVGIVVPGVVQLATALAFGMNLLVVGASGAVLLLVVAVATLQPNAMVLVFFFPVRLWVVASVYVLLDLFGLVRGAGGTAHLVHLSGAALGFALAKSGGLWFDPFDAWRARSAARADAQRESDEQRLDALLERIHKQGIGSLSDREREFLKRMSSRRGG